MTRRRGFTLIELLVVVGVLAVLAALAIPRFTAARDRARDATARSDLRSVFTTALATRAAGGAWPDAAAIAAADAGLRTTSGNAGAAGAVSIAARNGTFTATALSATGTCFRVTADATGTPTWTQDNGNGCMARPWTPEDLADSVGLWLDAADAATLTLDGATVSQWSDRSGRGNHATQSSPAMRPTFDGATRAVRTTSGTPLGFAQQLLAGATTASIFVVGTQVSGQSSWGHIGCCTSHHAPWNNNVLFDSFASTTRPGAPQALVRPFAGVPTLLGYEQTGTELRFWQSGNSLGSATTSYRIPANSLTEQRIGGTWPGTYDVHEIVLVRRVLDPVDRERIEGYLAHKWALTAQLPTAHPYRTTAPAP